MRRISSVGQVGLVQAVRVRLLNFLRRWVEFELCRIVVSSGKPYDFEYQEGFAARAVESSEKFHAILHDDLKDNDYSWAFERSDLCVANIADDKIVGFEFSTNQPTRVRPGVEFYFPEFWVYGFASQTAASFRGKRLARDRWKINRQMRPRRFTAARDVWYMNLANSAALKSDESDGMPSIRIGYSVYLVLSQRAYCWNSRGAKRMLCGFRVAD